MILARSYGLKLRGEMGMWRWRRGGMKEEGRIVAAKYVEVRRVETERDDRDAFKLCRRYVRHTISG